MRAGKRIKKWLNNLRGQMAEADDFVEHRMDRVLLSRFMQGALIVSGAALGAVAWPWCPALSLVVPLEWASRKPEWVTRGTMLAYVTGYYLGASRSLPSGFSEFYHGSHGTTLALGGAVWFMSSVALALPWIIVRPWVYRGWKRAGATAAGLALALGLTAVPPLGLFGWASPLFGVADVVAMVRHPALVAEQLGEKEPVEPAGWVALDTTMGMLPDTIAGTYNRETWLVRKTLDTLRQPQVRGVVLPETIAGVWEAGTQWVWRPVVQRTARTGQTVIVGAIGVDRRDGKDRRIDEAVVISDGKVRIVRPEAIPVPVSMWHPWDPHHEYAMRLFRDPVVTIDGERVALDICYSQLLPWTAALVMAGHPQLITGLSNDWWSASTNLPQIQAVSLRILADALDVPVVDAVNL
jgi:hypothetical protein